MGDDPRLPKIPDKPNLFDFYKYRFARKPGIQDVLQSANLAQKYVADVAPAYQRFVALPALRN